MLSSTTPAVSGHHLNLVVRQDGMAVIDLNSTNGTQVNGRRIQPNQKVWIVAHIEHIVERAQNLRQRFRVEFGRSAGAA